MTGFDVTRLGVIGSGAMGMAFTDALIDQADVHVTLVDRLHSAGGHWQDAYPFVRLHQSSSFYGVFGALSNSIGIYGLSGGNSGSAVGLRELFGAHRLAGPAPLVSLSAGPRGWSRGRARTMIATPAPAATKMVAFETIST